MRTLTRIRILRVGLWMVALSALGALLACDDLPSMRNRPNVIDGDLSEAENEATPDGDPDGETSEAGESDYDTAHLPLNEVLPCGTARGGELLSTESGGAKGLYAAAATGDFKLYNCKAAFVISGMASKRLLSPGAGAIRDLALLDAQGQARFDDPLVEAAPIVGFAPELLPGDGTLRVFVPTSAELVHNGADGRPAHLRFVGADQPFAPLDYLLEQTDELLERNPPYAITLDYYLDGAADHLRIEMTVTSEAAASDPNNTPARPALAWLDGGTLVRHYGGQSSNDLDFSGQTARITEAKMSWYGLAAKDSEATYGFFDAKTTGLSALSLPPGRLALVGNAADMKLKPGAVGTLGLDLWVGAGGFEALKAAENAAVPKPETRAQITGKIAAHNGLYCPVALWAWRETKKVANDQTTILRNLGAFVRLVPTAANASFSLALAPGDYALYAQNAHGEVGATQTFTVAESGVALSLPADLASPSCPAVVQVKVVEAAATQDAGTPLAARVEAYEYPDPKGHTPLATAITDAATGEATLSVPVDQLAEGAAKSLWLFTSRGLTYQAQSAAAFLKAGVDNAAITIRMAPPIDASLVRNVGTPQAIDAVLYSATLGGESALGPGGFVTPEARVANAQAEGLDLFLGGDTEAVLDYTPFLRQAALSARSMTLANGLKVESSQATLRAYGVSVPAERPAYYGLSTASYLDGTYSGTRSPSLLVKDLKDAYKAELVELATPRQAGAKGAFLDYAKYNPHQTFTLNGKEARDTLNAIDVFEIYDGGENFAYTYAALQDWYSLIAQNVFKPAVGHNDLADLTGLNGQRLGAPRTFVYLNKSETPSAAGILDAMRAGRSIVSGGPLVHLDVGGVLPGGTYDAGKDATTVLPDIYFNLKVSAPSQVGVSRAYLCVNGTDLYYIALGGAAPTLIDAKLHFTVPRKDAGFQDSWFVVLVVADPAADSAPTYPKRPPFAVTNPIFIEADGATGLSFPALPDDGRPLCVNEAICDSFANYDIAKTVVATKAECCGLFPTKDYCKP